MAEKDEGVAWPSELRATATLPAIVARAKTAGLFDIHVESVQGYINAAKVAQESWSAAHEEAGKVKDESKATTLQALIQRAVLTIGEHDILMVCTDSEVEFAKAKKIAKASMFSFRSAGIAEKRVLLPAVYKWAFDTITSVGPK